MQRQVWFRLVLGATFVAATGCSVVRYAVQLDPTATAIAPSACHAEVVRVPIEKLRDSHIKVGQLCVWPGDVRVGGLHDTPPPDDRRIFEPGDVQNTVIKAACAQGGELVTRTGTCFSDGVLQVELGVFAPVKTAAKR